MLEGFTEDELFDMAYDCQKKYEQKEVETIKKVFTGEITSNAQMIEALKDLNREYLDEACNYADFTTDLNPCTITCYKEAEERGDNFVETTYAIIRALGVFDEKKLVFTNDKGQPCDENGILLSKDLEHRVFEVIKGGKKKQLAKTVE